MSPEITGKHPEVADFCLGCLIYGKQEILSEILINETCLLTADCYREACFFVCSISLFAVGKPCEVSAMFPVVQVVHVPIRFALKGNVAVSLQQVAIDDKADEPFCDVPDKEKHEEHLQLLLGMYALVVQFPL